MLGYSLLVSLRLLVLTEYDSNLTCLSVHSSLILAGCYQLLKVLQSWSVIPCVGISIGTLRHDVGMFAVRGIIWTIALRCLAVAKATPREPTMTRGLPSIVTIVPTIVARTTLATVATTWVSIGATILSASAILLNWVRSCSVIWRTQVTTITTAVTGSIVQTLTVTARALNSTVIVAVAAEWATIVTTLTIEVTVLLALAIAIVDLCLHS